MGDTMAHQAPDPAVLRDEREKRIRELEKDPNMDVPEPDLSGVPKVQEKDILGLRNNGTLDDALKKLEAPKAEEPKPEAPAPKVEEPKEEHPKFLKNAFEKLAKDRAALRAEADAVKPLAEVAKAFDAGTLTALARARAAGDKLGMLAALGVSYKELVADVIDRPGKAPAKAAPAPGPEEDDRYSALKAELEALKQERMQEKTTSMRNELVGRVKGILGDKFPLVSELGTSEQVFGMLERHMYQNGGTMPADDYESSILLMAEAAEQQWRDQATKWERILTKAKPQGTLPNVVAPSDAGPSGRVAPGKTLTNAAVAPRTAAPEPQTRAERIKALQDDPNLDW